MKLTFETFLVNRFQESRTEFPINFKNGPLNFKTLVSQDDLFVFFVHFVVLLSRWSYFKRLTVLEARRVVIWEIAISLSL